MAEKSNPNDLVFKFIAVGNAGKYIIRKEHPLTNIFCFRIGVGKSALLMRYIKNEFKENYNVTIGADFQSKNVKVNDGE